MRERKLHLESDLHARDSPRLLRCHREAKEDVRCIYQYKDIRNCSASLGHNGPTAWYHEAGSPARVMDVLTTTATNALEHTSSIFPVVQYVLAVGSNTSPEATWNIVDTVNTEKRFIATECTLELVVRSVQADITEGEYAKTMLTQGARWETPNCSSSANYQVVLTPSENGSLGLTTPSQTFGIGYESWSARHL
ncbi:hypothetical protein BJX68DRAFT_261857 [Aspergillus pseudodeflectus]|uniref:Uncharacterized protein n=1 Tax=Aspergillus pseudodeflectus TaxID=176178 RepID=A0ABR4L4G2_9EURO